MSATIDTSVLVAAMVAEEKFHRECARLLDSGEKKQIYSHGFSEAFSTLTGGRRFKIPASTANDLITEDYAPCLEAIALSVPEIFRAMSEAESRSVRGAAIFDYLHFSAARKAKAKKFYTLNLSNFQAFHRTGEPEIVHPA